MLKIELFYDPATALLDIYPKGYIMIHRGTCTLMFIAAMSKIAKLWREPRCPPTNECIKTWYRVLGWLSWLGVCLAFRS